MERTEEKKRAVEDYYQQACCACRHWSVQDSDGRPWCNKFRERRRYDSTCRTGYEVVEGDELEDMYAGMLDKVEAR